LIAPALVRRYGKGTDSDATDAMVVADTVRSHPRPGSNSNGNIVALAENQRGELLETDYAHQLTNGGGKPGQGYGAVRVDAAVRRLTPVECERLQGFPDNWTRLDDSTPDSRRYAALGDAVTVNVAQWIGRRLLQHVQKVAA
jgi:site-specific DNA-cytosine methylase